jgi:hypothetical protein
MRKKAALQFKIEFCLYVIVKYVITRREIWRKHRLWRCLPPGSTIKPTTSIYKKTLLIDDEKKSLLAPSNTSTSFVINANWKKIIFSDKLISVEYTAVNKCECRNVLRVCVLEKFRQRRYISCYYSTWTEVSIEKICTTMFVLFYQYFTGLLFFLPSPGRIFLFLSTSCRVLEVIKNYIARAPCPVPCELPTSIDRQQFSIARSIAWQYMM